MEYSVEYTNLHECWLERLYHQENEYLDNEIVSGTSDHGVHFQVFSIEKDEQRQGTHFL
jgi:hypothetical protein